MSKIAKAHYKLLQQQQQQFKLQHPSNIHSIATAAVITNDLPEASKLVIIVWNLLDPTEVGSTIAVLLLLLYYIYNFVYI